MARVERHRETRVERQRETLIYVLVEATDHGTAISRAKPVLEDVVAATDRPIESFRDYATFHGDGPEGHRSAWGEKPSAATVETDTGQELLEEACERMHRVFEDNLATVEELLETYTAEELMRNADDARRYFLRLGATVGPSVPLYAETGCPIRDRGELEQFLETHGEVWIVPAIGVS